MKPCGAITRVRSYGWYAEGVTETGALVSRQIERRERNRIEIRESQRQSTGEKGRNQIGFGSISRQHWNVGREVCSRCGTRCGVCALVIEEEEVTILSALESVSAFAEMW